MVIKFDKLVKSPYSAFRWLNKNADMQVSIDSEE